MNLTYLNTLKLLTDNKELIPEFYSESTFLVNSNNVELGTDHLG